MRLATRHRCAVLLWALLVAGPAAASSLTAGQPPQSGQQQPRRPAEDEFVPIGELPEEEKLPAAPLLIAAYSVAWIAVAAYLFSIWRRLGRVQAELTDLANRLQPGRAGPHRSRGAPDEPGAR